MKTQKTLIGYRLTETRRSQHISDVQHVTLLISSLDKIDPATELLTASHYSDGSLQNAQSKVRRASALGFDHWLESHYYNVDISLEFQGDITRNNWYACRVDGMSFQAQNIALLSKLVKFTGNTDHVSDALETVLAALRSLKAIEIKYDTESKVWFPATETSPIIQAINDRARSRVTAATVGTTFENAD